MNESEARKYRQAEELHLKLKRQEAIRKYGEIIGAAFHDYVNKPHSTNADEDQARNQMVEAIGSLLPPDTPLDAHRVLLEVIDARIMRAVSFLAGQIKPNNI